ncbi:MAG: thiamine-phosphate pyrophosphorylase [Candidatus Omnitrophica bacterium]|nr:thiamine-phosphate pyrophosphorylase [Candidatus Omnitrophota bacterium]
MVKLPGIYRIMDANLNRCREGLRVIEDIFRFYFKDDMLRRRLRTIRHTLDTLNESALTAKFLAARDSVKDQGRHTDCFEMGRKDIGDIFYANMQRAKESLRVLEEFLKIEDRARVTAIKKARYGLYTIEKKAFLRWPALRDFR